MKKMLKKLRSTAGESIGETLIALLISALALGMLAGAVSSASNIITRSNDAMNDYYTNIGTGETEWYNAIKSVIQ